MAVTKHGGHVGVADTEDGEQALQGREGKRINIKRRYSFPVLAPSPPILPLAKSSFYGLDNSPEGQGLHSAPSFHTPYVGRIHSQDTSRRNPA